MVYWRHDFAVLVAIAIYDMSNFNSASSSQCVHKNTMQAIRCRRLCVCVCVFHSSQIWTIIITSSALLCSALLAYVQINNKMGIYAFFCKMNFIFNFDDVWWGRTLFKYVHAKEKPTTSVNDVLPSCNNCRRTLLAAAIHRKFIRFSLVFFVYIVHTL